MESFFFFGDVLTLNDTHPDLDCNRSFLEPGTPKLSYTVICSWIKHVIFCNLDHHVNHYKILIYRYCFLLLKLLVIFFSVVYLYKTTQDLEW